MVPARVRKIGALGAAACRGRENVKLRDARPEQVYALEMATD
jgi:hypothetical protein